MSKRWTTSDILKLYRLEESSKTPLIYAEEKGEIPTAERFARGRIMVREWSNAQLPSIGEKFGFLKKPKSQVVICVYTPKGGVTKTTFSVNLARTLAINGIKTMVCGLDFQQSLSRYLLPEIEIKSVDDIGKNQSLGLYHFLYERAPLSSVIKPTDLPTLDIIPETSDLNFMAKKMRLDNRREYIIAERLLPPLKDYDVVIFDCNPGWSDLTENALVAANSIVMPIACETECLEALRSNLEEITDFQKNMKLHWSSFYLIPTLLENNSISQNIYASYLNMFKESIIPSPIRRSIIAQEARVNKLSILEFDPKSNLAQDYFEVINDLWTKIT